MSYHTDGGTAVRLKTAYCQDNDVRERLYPLFEDVFGVSVQWMRTFYQRGFWDPSYRPYTYFDGTRAVANVSRFDLPLVVRGEHLLAAGIQSVMTHPGYRHRGLMTRLMERMLEDIDRRHEVSVLFTEHPSLYEPFGFRTVPDVRYEASLSEAVEGVSFFLRRLDLGQPADAQILRDTWRGSAPLSWSLSPTAAFSAVAFNGCQGAWRERLYYHAGWNAMLAYQVEQETLWLYTVVARQIPSPFEIVRAVGVPSVRRLVLDVCPDRFPGLEWTPIPHEGSSHLMVRGSVAFPEGVAYPDIARF